jgi:outer membrane biosynthesis protein TonB
MAAAARQRDNIAIAVILAALAHVALFVLLSLARMGETPPSFEATPIEVSLTDNIGLKSEAPEIEKEAPAERLAEVPAPVEPESPPPVPQTQPEPVAKPDPTPPKAAPAPAPKPRPQEAAKKSNPAPAKAQPQQPTRQAARPTGRLSGIVDGLTDQPSKGKATRPPATQIGAAVQSSVFAEIRRQVKPHWRSPTGADVNLLITQVEVRLRPDGSLAAEPRIIRQTGVNESNKPQQQLHGERAINAIKLAAPFKNLPDEYYEAWKGFVLSFDRRL